MILFIRNSELRINEDNSETCPWCKVLSCKASPCHHGAYGASVRLVIYHGTHHCKASPCHHGAATSEWQSRDGFRKDISWQSHARQSQSFVVGDGVGIFFVHLIVLCFLFLHYILFNRFAHSAGPGVGPQRVEVVGSGFDGLMQSSK